MAIKTIFKTIDQVQEFITIDISSDINTILPYIKQAEKFITEIIGTPLLNQLLEHVHEDGEDNNLNDLLTYARLPLINFAYMIGGEKLSVNIGENGITTTEVQNLSPAEEWRMKGLTKSFASAGYDGLEDLLKFLEDNAKSYPKWQQSKAYSYNKQFFINNAKDVNDSIFIDIRRIDFLKLKPFIFQVEQSEIIPTISRRYFNQLKAEILENNISSENAIVLNTYIKPAVCYHALGLYEKNDVYKLEGTKYVEELKDFLNENADNYFYYKDSDCYEEPGTAEDINDEDSGFYAFGHL